MSWRLSGLFTISDWWPNVSPRLMIDFQSWLSSLSQLSARFFLFSRLCGFPPPCLILHRACRRTCCDWALVWTPRTPALPWPHPPLPAPPQPFPAAGVLDLRGPALMCLTSRMMRSALRGRPACTGRLQVNPTYLTLQNVSLHRPCCSVSIFSCVSTQGV